ncbi:ribbon-helix-helix protein, CopG family [Aggregatibacter kilianii]|uniref:ribbon-helix-helix protein, CopG family n=1 Tax=Aggregatibacter kilianii TaxID=2025884 RepID=UPI000D643D52|nr:ribbon-helix-helix protein, CopG family [Aggregatibacter kilianii]
MSYQKLSAERKKAISRNAAEYAKNNYKQIKISLTPDIAYQFDSICAEENLSRPELIKKMIELYGSQK